MERVAETKPYVREAATVGKSGRYFAAQEARGGDRGISTVRVVEDVNESRERQSEAVLEQRVGKLVLGLGETRGP